VGPSDSEQGVSIRTIAITIDTEVDKQADWSISRPARFTSVTSGIPTVLSPLFDRYGVKPTYLLSPEVIEDEASAEVLRSLDGRAELGTHLHLELVDPDRRLTPENMSGQRADMIQRQLTPEDEEAKLTTLTALFGKAFGYPPRSFRAGRYGMSDDTLGSLAKLGYLVDSSVTPGLRWRYAEGELDYRNETTAPHWVDAPAGRILELPVSVWPRSALALWVQALSPGMERWARRGLRSRAGFQWLRPSWGGGDELARAVDEHPDNHLVAMFHSMEVIPGASPYARDEAGVRRIVSALEQLIQRCRDRGVVFCGLSEVPAHL
jgi:hypothetical protein